MAMPTLQGTYTVYIDNLMISKSIDEIKNEEPIKYAYMSGTSMAAPYVTGAFAVVSNIYNNTPLNNKSILLSATRETAITSDTDTTRKILDLSKIRLELSSKTYTINNDTKIITKINQNTSVSNFKKNIDGIITCQIKDKNNTILNDEDIIKTGCKLVTSDDEYILIVRGDLNGNGNIDTNDLAQAQKLYLQLIESNNLKVLATDLNNANGVDLNDLAKIQKIFIGIE